jgi:hypothetical protein
MIPGRLPTKTIGCPQVGQRGMSSLVLLVAMESAAANACLLQAELVADFDEAFAAAAATTATAPFG